MLPTRRKLRKLGTSISGDFPFCFKVEENLDHTVSERDLATNMWRTTANNCPNPINTNLGIVDWLEYLWLNKFWYRELFL